jgi:hypothetical protein
MEKKNKPDKIALDIGHPYKLSIYYLTYLCNYNPIVDLGSSEVTKNTSNR